MNNLQFVYGKKTSRKYQLMLLKDDMHVPVTSPLIAKYLISKEDFIRIVDKYNCLYQEIPVKCMAFQGLDFIEYKIECTRKKDILGLVEELNGLIVLNKIERN